MFDEELIYKYVQDFYNQLIQKQRAHLKISEGFKQTFASDGTQVTNKPIKMCSVQLGNPSGNISHNQEKSLCSYEDISRQKTTKERQKGELSTRDINLSCHFGR